MHLEFDYSKCTKCGLCARVCGSKVIESDETKRPVVRMPLVCNDCGHCMAVCPTGAVVNTRLDPAQILPMADPGISYEQYLRLVRNRRSIRLYRPDPIKPEHMTKILEAVRYIPTGSNKQGLHFSIITNPAVLKDIKAEMARRFHTANTLIHLPIIRRFVREEDRVSMAKHIELWKAGHDQYLRDAPCLLIISTDKAYFGISSWDAGIASYNIDLTAQTLGLGTMMNGFHVVTCGMFRSMRKVSRIPKGHKVLVSICLGYPAVKYRNTVSRLPLKITRQE